VRRKQEEGEEKRVKRKEEGKGKRKGRKGKGKGKFFKLGNF
jgi:hypothetical protein